MESCVLCFDPLQQDTRILLECKHDMFHKTCLLKHFKSECPLCRHPHHFKVTGEEPREEIPFHYEDVEEIDHYRPSTHRFHYDHSPTRRTPYGWDPEWDEMDRDHYIELFRIRECERELTFEEEQSMNEIRDRQGVFAREMEDLMNERDEILSDVLYESSYSRENSEIEYEDV
jgi:transposase-like protein